MEDYLADRTLLVRYACRQEVDPDARNAQPAPPSPSTHAVGWSTGAIISSSGAVLTVRHAYEKAAETCTPLAVDISFYQISELPAAEEDLGGGGLSATALVEVPTRRYLSLVADYMILQIGAHGFNTLPYVCGLSDPNIVDADYVDLGIAVGGVAADIDEGRFQWRFMPGTATATKGPDNMTNQMTATVSPGMSGAAVVDETGRIVGLAVASGPAPSAPSGFDHLFLPSYSWNAERVFAAFADRGCATTVTPPPNVDLDQPPQFLLQETAALTVDPGQDGRRAAIFLPANTLLFPMEPAENTPQGYARVLTQDGVRALVPETSVWEGPPLHCFASGDVLPQCVVFHAATSLCLHRDRCFRCGDPNACRDDRAEIPPGEIALELGTDGGLVHFEIDRAGGRVSFYEFTDLVSQLENHAIITRLGNQSELRQPHFEVTVDRSQLLRTTCGVPWQAGKDETQVSALTPFELELVGAFGLAQVTPLVAGVYDMLSRITHVGGPGELREYRKYTFENTRSGPNVTLFAEITYACNGPRILWIEEVLLLSPAEEAPPAYLRSWSNHPAELREFIPDAYLWVINTEEHYMRVMSLVHGELQNRAIAGFFVAEFGRSCSPADITPACQSIQFY